MASITLDIAYSYAKVPVNDIDLESVSNIELIEAAWEADVFTEADRMFMNTFGQSSKGCWRIITKEGRPILDKYSLASLGFVDGDTIKVVAKPVC